MKTILRGLARPLPAWLTLMLFAVIPLTATAAYPTLWANWVVANASVTPSPAPTGYAGPVVVAQATNAPTAQPGNISVAGTVKGCQSATCTVTYLGPIYNAAGTTVASTEHIVQGTVTAAGASTTVTLSGAAAFAATGYFIAIYDVTGGTYVALTGYAAGSFSFASTNTHIYVYLAVGA